MSYADEGHAFGARADADLQVAKDALAAATADDASDATALAACRARVDTLTTQRDNARAEVARLKLVVADLKNQLNPTPTARTLFAAKPEPDSEAEYAASELRAGVPYPVHRHYDTSWAAATATVKGCKGRICAVTVAVISNGNLLVDAAAIKSWPDRPIHLGVLHEPEDNIEAHQLTLAGFKDAQTKTRAAVDAANADPARVHKIRFGICLQGPWTWQAASGRHADDYYMPEVHDFVGTDPYPEFINHADNFAVTAEQMFALQVAWAKDRNVDLTVPEWGIEDDDPPDKPGARAAWIRKMCAYARANNMLWLSYWDHQLCYCRNDDEFAAAGGA